MEGDPDLPANEATGLLSSARKTEAENAEDDKDTPVHKDIHDTIFLAVPIFLAMLSWVGVRT